MKLLDTVAIIGALNPSDSRHKQCLHHLNRVEVEPDAFVPQVSILEADLVMKARGYDADERRTSWRALEHKVPARKLATNSIASVRRAVTLQQRGLDYFDSLIASLALEHTAVVITTDPAIERIVRTEW